ncbi:hypothetical protein WJX73_010598 [Symbiochloris irregularis]|uniref:CRAL-TRIO domain-containing protein n=1 Tax=Symbiochloris irregularis TaxID=706552 RepID=A0AAW1PV47_9CHLO
MEDPATATSADDAKVRAADVDAAVFELRDDACKHLSIANQMFCTDSTLKRFLRARSYDLAKASAMLKATLAWRERERPEHITFDDIQAATVTGRVELMSDPDTSGLPVILYRLRQKMPDLPPETQVNFLTYILESSAHVADASTSEGKCCWLFDMAAYDRKNSPPLAVVRECINLFQNHYPERLGKAIVYQPNWAFRMVYSLISPFLDPVTRSKIEFISTSSEEQRVEQLSKLVASSAVDACAATRPDVDVESYAQRMRQLDAVPPYE